MIQTAGSGAVIRSTSLVPARVRSSWLLEALAREHGLRRRRQQEVDEAACGIDVCAAGDRGRRVEDGRRCRYLERDAHLVLEDQGVGCIDEAGVDFDHSICADLVECVLDEESDPLVLVPEGLLDGLDELVRVGITDLEGIWWPLLKPCLDTDNPTHVTDDNGVVWLNADVGRKTASSRLGAAQSLIALIHERGIQAPAAVINQLVDHAFTSKQPQELAELGILLRQLDHPEASAVIADALSFPGVQN